MDHLDKVLTTVSDSPYRFGAFIHAAHHYYHKTDHSEVLYIILQWVSHCIISKLKHIMMCALSATSLPQARILQEAQVGE